MDGQTNVCLRCARYVSNSIAKIVTTQVVSLDYTVKSRHGHWMYVLGRSKYFREKQRTHAPRPGAFAL